MANNKTVEENLQKIKNIKLYTPEDIINILRDSKVPLLGVPENGDICYIVGQPLECNRDSEYWKYLLFRESDGKLFVMDGHGFEFIFD